MISTFYGMFSYFSCIEYLLLIWEHIWGKGLFFFYFSNDFLTKIGTMDDAEFSHSITNLVSQKMLVTMATSKMTVSDKIL